MPLRRVGRHLGAQSAPVKATADLTIEMPLLTAMAHRV
jgi:hypothetical protein